MLSLFGRRNKIPQPGRTEVIEAVLPKLVGVYNSPREVVKVQFPIQWTRGGT